MTGGCGLIGRPTVAALLAEGAVVTVLDRVASDADVRSIVGDVTDPAVLAEAVAGQDAVVHLGGYAGLGMADAVETYRVNAVGSFAVFAAAAAAGVAKVVYASSINANGYPLGAEQVLPPVFPYSEDAVPRISDEYSLSKLATEDAARMAHATWGLSLTGLRYPLVRDITVDGGRVFGAHLRAALAADPRRQAAEGWSYLDAADSARAGARGAAARDAAGAGDPGRRSAHLSAREHRGRARRDRPGRPARAAQGARGRARPDPLPRAARLRGAGAARRRGRTGADVRAGSGASSSRCSASDRWARRWRGTCSRAGR